MSGFLVGALLVAIVTITLVVWPFLRRGTKADFSRLQLNTAIYRDQLAELERDRREGSLSQADYEQAQAELQRRMLEDTAGEPVSGEKTGNAVAQPVSRALPIALGAFLLIGGAIGYMALGNPLAINPPMQEQHSIGDAEIERMVAEMAAKLEKEPENYRGWAMLARSYKVLNRYPEAAKAYARTGPMLDTSAELLVDYADALAAAERGFTKEVLVLIDKALKLEPTNMQGLWLRGTAFFEEKRYDKAIADWELLLKGLPPDSEEARVVAGNIAETRELHAQAGGKPLKASVPDKANKAGKPAEKVGAGATVAGRIEVAGNLAGKILAGAQAMVVARPADGSRMPVAVFIAPAKASLDFVLDETTAMSPSNPLANHAELLVEARISASGQAMPVAGDLFGPAQRVKLGARGVQLKVDQVRQ